MGSRRDAVVTGVVPSIARPGGNITGSTFFNPELGAKRLELLKEAFPRSRRVGVLVNPANAMARVIVPAMEAPAGSLNTELQVFEARRPAEFENAFLVMAERRVDAVTVIEDELRGRTTRTYTDSQSHRACAAVLFQDHVRAIRHHRAHTTFIHEPRKLPEVARLLDAAPAQVQGSAERRLWAGLRAAED